jgi:hypothetical protein
MPQIKHLSGANWPASGAATAGSTGMEVAPVNLSHYGSADVPPGSAATGHLAPTNPAADAIFQIVGTPFNGDGDHWVSFWLKASVTGTLAVDNTYGGNVGIATDGVASNVNARLYLRNTADYARGIALRVGVTTIVETYHGELDGATDANGGLLAILGFDAWQQITLHVAKGASGVLEAYVNGMLVTRITGNFSVFSDAQIRNFFYLRLPVIAGVGWKLGAPIESWSGTDIARRPDWSRNAAGDHLRKAFPIALMDAPKGAQWSSAGSTATVAATRYPAQGSLVPRRHRAVVSTAGTATLTTVDKVGVLPYGPSGWATFLFPNLLVGSGGALAIALHRDDGTTGEQLDIGGGFLSHGGRQQFAWDSTHGYLLAVQFSAAGEMRAFARDLSVDMNAGQVAWGAICRTSGAADVSGTVSMALTRGSTSGELEGFWLCSTVDPVMVDSISSAQYTSASPNFNLPGRVFGAFFNGQEPYLVPGGNYPFREQGLPRLAPFPLGNPGGQRHEFDSGVKPNLNLKGARLWLVDGAAVNDAHYHVASATERDQQIASISASTVDLIRWASSQGNEIVLCTQIPRVKGLDDASWTAHQVNASQGLNREMVLAARLHQNGQRVKFADVASLVADYRSLFGADMTHFASPSGEITVAKAMVDALTTPARVGGIRHLLGTR